MMKRFLTATCVGALSCIASGAIAQSAIDSEVSFDYISAPDDSFEYQLQLSGSVERRFGQFGVQGNLLLWQYEDDDGDFASSVTLHAFYEVIPGLDAGLAFTADIYENGGVASYAFIEANYTTGANTVEGFYGHDALNKENTYFGLEYTHDFGAVGSIDGLEVFAGYVENYYVGAINIPNSYIGANFAVGNGFDVTARYATMDYGEYRYITLGVTKTFGAGTTFSNRGFSGMFPGY